MSRIRVAQIAPLYESVPPKLYGGTERVVFNLSEALVRMGHEVTLFASGDSLTSGRLVPTGREGLRLAKINETLAPHILMFERVRALAQEFDVIHFHNEYSHFGLARSLDKPTVSTMHGRLDLPEYRDLYFEFRELPMISISENQRRPLSYQNWVATIHHGMPKDAIPFSSKDSGYLAFLGRLSPQKGFEKAVEIARRVKMPLKIAAKIDAADREYFENIKGLLDDPLVEFVGEIGDRDKPAFLGGAKALLFPINWPEPFGLVMIEAMAAGTPVIAFRHGSVPEVIRNGETGFIVENVDEACDAIACLGQISRKDCRHEFELRFTVERMAADYVNVYRQLIVDHRQNHKLNIERDHVPMSPAFMRGIQ